MGEEDGSPWLPCGVWSFDRWFSGPKLDARKMEVFSRPFSRDRVSHGLVGKVSQISCETTQREPIMSLTELKSTALCRNRLCKHQTCPSPYDRCMLMICADTNTTQIEFNTAKKSACYILLASFISCLLSKQ